MTSVHWIEATEKLKALLLDCRETLAAERQKSEGYRNGQLQVQDTLDGVMTSNTLMAARIRELEAALRRVESFAPADGTHGACLECGRPDVVLELKGHDDGCALGFFIRTALLASEP